MEYHIQYPRFRGDSIGRLFRISNFRDLMAFFRHVATVTDDISTHFHGCSTLEDYLNSSEFTECSFESNFYIHGQCIQEAIDGNISSYDNFLLNSEYVYSSRERLFIHRSDAIFVHGSDDYVTTTYAENHFYFHNDGECYTYEEEYDKYVRSYHEGDSYKSGLLLRDYDGFCVGIEFEKEDYKVKTSIPIYDFEDSCYLWRKEEDGSLDRESGFELISPIYPLDTDLIINSIKENEVLLNHVNASTSNRCGGHVNLSHNLHKYSAESLFDRVKFYLPLLYAMYPNRTCLDYCIKKKISGNESSFMRKYSPIAIKGDRIEFRIFSAIKNVNHLRFRLDLVKMMAENKVSSFWEVFQVVEKHRNLFLRVYTPEKLETMLSRLKREIEEELEASI
jgi:hypothetical protein